MLSLQPVKVQGGSEGQEPREASKRQVLETKRMTLREREQAKYPHNPAEVKRMGHVASVRAQQHLLSPWLEVMEKRDQLKVMGLQQCRFNSGVQPCNSAAQHPALLEGQPKFQPSSWTFSSRGLPAGCREEGQISAV